MNKQLELLAPVGSMDALVAAVMNGADAVYLGGKSFNARKYASNFDNNQLVEAISYAHLRGVSVFVTLNILLDDSEILQALEYVKLLYEIGVDGIIVQDLGLAALIREIFPLLDIHASTQMTINNLEGAKHLEKLGFTRAVLAREVPFQEIKRIKQGSNIELEVFIHGALCISYSGQCLMSSLIGGRSGNRGTCAQPCRMEYSIADKDGKLLNDSSKAHYLSTRDLNTLDQVEELIKLGVKSFKIEGRMKRPEYVATVVSTYRKAMDLGSESLNEHDRIDVEQMFNREFTKGLTFGDFGRDFVSVERPDNRGRIIGKVVAVEKRRVQILLFEDVNFGDGLEWNIHGRQRDGTKANFSGTAGEKKWIDRVKESALLGSALRKTSSTELLKRAQKSYINRDLNFPIAMSIRIRKGELLKLVLNYNSLEVIVFGENVVEPSINNPITKERIYQQLSKLGNTVFNLDKLVVDLDENVFITVKELNALRRIAIEKLENDILLKYKRNPIVNYIEKKKKSTIINTRGKEIKKLTVRVNNQKQFNQLNLDKVSRVYINFKENLDKNLKSLMNQNIEGYYRTNKILYHKDLMKLESIVTPNLNLLSGISASNIGTIEFCKNNFNIDIHGDIGLNAFNSYTIDYLRKVGLKGITLSSELNLTQIKSIVSRVGGENEAIVYGYLSAMITRNCPMAYLKGCKNDNGCNKCIYAKGYQLNDKMNKNFMMKRDDGFTTIYNCVPVMVLDRLDDIVKSGISSFRLDFTFEDNIREIQEIYYDYLNGVIKKSRVLDFMTSYKKINEVTNGHFFRGVI